MGQAVLRIDGSPESALDAAAAFHRDWLPRARRLLCEADALALVFTAAAYDHRGWRLAGIQDLAREATPRRVNGIAGDDPDAIDQTTAWLASAPGITGQLLTVE